MNQTGILESICKRILDLDPKIRFVGIISNKGKLLAGSEKEGVKMLVDKRNHEMLFMEVALRVRMRQEFDKQLGPVNFTVSHRAKMVIMSFLLEVRYCMYQAKMILIWQKSHQRY